MHLTKKLKSLLVLLLPLFTFQSLNAQQLVWNGGFHTVPLTEKLELNFRSEVPKAYIVAPKGSHKNYTNFDYIGDGCYYVPHEKLDEFKNFKGIAKFKNIYKIHPKLNKETQRIEIVLSKQANTIESVKKLHSLGLEIEKYKKGSPYLVAKYDNEILDQIIELQEVLMLIPNDRLDAPEDLRSKHLHRSFALDNPYAEDLGFDGNGVKCMVRDDGAIGPHLDFNERLINLTSDEEGTHGDGVAGILGSAGNIDPEARGMAPGAIIYGVQYESSFLDNTLDLHLNENVLYTNSSFGNGCNDGYTANAAEVDRQIFENPTLMHVFSAGNANTRDCEYGAGPLWGNITGGHKLAKNCIATGNVNPTGQIRESSSRGPATDGRIKPDLVANGHNNYSTFPFDEYDFFSGTSGAAPCVVGAFAQLHQAYQELYEEAPSSALLKASLLNSADDSGPKGPDFTYGFGVMDIFGAYQILEEQNFIKRTIIQSDTLEQEIQLNAGDQLKILLYWADPPASPLAEKALVNDLDLEVVIDDSIYLPLVLDHRPNENTLANPAVPGKDTLNNVEQVLIDNYDGSLVQVRVIGSRITQANQEFYLTYEVEKEPEFRWLQPYAPYTIQENTFNVAWEHDLNASIDFLNYYINDSSTFRQRPQFEGDFEERLRRIDVSPGDSIFISYSTEDTTYEFPHTLYYAPAHDTGHIKVDQICFDSIRLSWDQMEGAVGYEVYRLEGAEMIFYTQTSNQHIAIPIDNVNTPKAYALRTIYPNGVKSRRGMARPLRSIELTNCPQEIELELLSAELSDTLTILCEPTVIDLELRIINNGILKVDSFDLNISLGDSIIQARIYQVLGPQEEAAINIEDLIPIDTVYSSIDLSVHAIGDLFPNNDSFSIPLNYLYFPQFNDTNNSTLITFNPSNNNYQIFNEDEQIGWEETNVRGKNNVDGPSIFINFYDYFNQASIDEIWVPVSVPDTDEPILSFDYSHKKFDELSTDQLEIDFIDKCGSSEEASLLYQRDGNYLSKGKQEINSYAPTTFNEWFNEKVNLQTIRGQEGYLRFRGISGYGNNLYIDNISILPASSYYPNVFVYQDANCADSVTVLHAINSALINTTDELQISWAILNDFSNIDTTESFTVDPQDVDTVVVFSENAYGYNYQWVDISETRFLPFIPQVLEAGDTIIIINPKLPDLDSVIWQTSSGFTFRKDTNVYIRNNNEPSVKFSAQVFRNCRDTSFAFTYVFTSSTTLESIRKLQIYPNPVTQQRLKIVFDRILPKDVKINLYDLNGRLITQWKNHRASTIIDLELTAPMSEGLYILQIDSEALKASKKIYVKH